MHGFYNGARVIYRGTTSKIPYGTYGTVIGLRDEMFEHFIAVSWDGKDHEYSSLDGLDPKGASLWCSPSRLELEESDDWFESVDSQGIDELLFD